VREARKQYGSCRQVEGEGDREQPVVIVDDSIASGASLKNAASALEADGYRIEGVVCLVNFPGRGGVEWAEALGIPVITLFDAWADLVPVPQHIPGFRRVAPIWETTRRVGDGLDPASAARQIALHYLTHRNALRPPKEFDDVYDAKGGVFVSIRNRQTNERFARAGFWHFRARDASFGRDLALATVKSINA